MSYTLEIVLILSSYLLGCLSTGYYLVRLRTGQDIRNLGSGSTGTRNVGRFLGIRGFIITALGDLTKGIIPVVIALYFEFNIWVVMLVIIATVAGHIWPIHLRFKGGRGVVTAAGALIVFDYRIILVAFLIAGLTYVATRRLTLSGLLAISLSPAIAVIFRHNIIVIVGILALVLIILIAHRSYVRDFLRVIRGRTEKDETK